MKSLYTIHPATRLGIGTAVVLVSLLAGCGGYSGGSGYAMPAATLTSIAIVPSSEELTTGTTARLTAVGNYSNGTTADITNSVIWSSAAPSTASVGSGTGVVTGNAVGTASITATLNNSAMYGGVISATESTTVTAATVTGITIAPVTTSVAKGTTVTFSATGGFSDGSTGNISGAVTWASSDTTVATVDASGIAKGVGAGSCTISASLNGNGIANTAALTVF